MLPVLLLGQTTSVDTPAQLAVANRGSVLLVRREAMRYAVIAAKRAARGEMPRAWRTLPRPPLAAIAYRSGFLVAERRGGLLFLDGSGRPMRLAGPTPKGMPQLPLQSFGLDGRGRPFLLVNLGGDTSEFGLAVFDRKGWRVATTLAERKRVYVEGPEWPAFEYTGKGGTLAHLWIPTGPRLKADLLRWLPHADWASALTTADPELRAYWVRQGEKVLLATVRGGRVRVRSIAMKEWSINDRLCFVPADDRLLELDGARLIVYPAQRPIERR